MWAHYVNNGSVNGILEYYHCPPGYCRCRNLDEGSEECNSVYSYSDENFQCVCDRKGLLLIYCITSKAFITGFLCGKCQYDKGVSVLLNNCKSCGTANSLLILALGIATVINFTIKFNALIVTVVANVFLVIIILIASVKIPPWLFPILFYLQVGVLQ